MLSAKQKSKQLCEMSAIRSGGWSPIHEGDLQKIACRIEVFSRSEEDLSANVEIRERVGSALNRLSFSSRLLFRSPFVLFQNDLHNRVHLDLA
jgi:hypothetical protein